MGIDLDPLAHRLAGARLERERAAAGRAPDRPQVSLLHGNYRCARGAGAAPGLTRRRRCTGIDAEALLRRGSIGSTRSFSERALEPLTCTRTNGIAAPQPGAAPASGAAWRLAGGQGGRHADGPGGVVHAGGGGVRCCRACCGCLPVMHSLQSFGWNVAHAREQARSAHPSPNPSSPPALHAPSPSPARHRGARLQLCGGRPPGHAARPGRAAERSRHRQQLERGAAGARAA